MICHGHSHFCILQTEMLSSLLSASPSNSYGLRVTFFLKHSPPGPSSWRSPPSPKQLINDNSHGTLSTALYYFLLFSLSYGLSPCPFLSLQCPAQSQALDKCLEPLSWSWLLGTLEKDSPKLIGKSPGALGDQGDGERCLELSPGRNLFPTVGQPHTAFCQ